jgi:hypothetical protein
MSDSGITDIDELEERLKDDDAVFSASEVRKLIEWREHRMQKDIYNTARVASVMTSTAQIVEDSRAAMQRLLDIREAEAARAPIFQVVQL